MAIDDNNLTSWGYWVIVNRTGLTLRMGKRIEVFSWLRDDDFAIDNFDEALESVNSDGWHHSFHETEEQARTLANAGVYCHGRHYYPS